MEELKNTNEVSKRGLLKFVFFSMIGLGLFIFPIRTSNGSVTIAVSIIDDFIRKDLRVGEFVPYINLVLFYISALGALYVKLAKPKWLEKYAYLKTIFETSWMWIIVRLLAMVFATMVIFNFGPEHIISDSTGGNILWGIVPKSTTILIVCAFALPLLLEFGLLEFVGIIIHKPFRKIFNLPGRAAIDCIASWVGSSTMGIILTDVQYKSGGYTLRESSVIITCFSAATIASSLSFLALVDMKHLFVPFYLIVILMGIICAIVLPHVPPLSRKKDTYYPGATPKVDSDALPEGYTRFQFAVEAGVKIAKESYTIKSFFIDALKTCTSVLFKVTPSLMAIGTIALIISEYTGFFDIFGIIFYPFFKLVGLPDAMAAGSTIMGSFADNFIPGIIASTKVASPITQFVIILVSYNSLIYMTGPGSIMLQTETKLTLGELFAIFLQRVILSIVLGGIFSQILFKFMM